MSTTDEQWPYNDLTAEEKLLWTDIQWHAARRATAVSEPAAPVDARDALTANRDAWMAQAQALAQAAGQASFCLRTLVPDDPDAQMTVRLLDAALAAPSTAAIREDEHAVFEEDGDDGKWRISASGATRKAEPAAPVDALMQMAREELSVMASYANTPDLSVGLRIRAIASAECIAKIDAERQTEASTMKPTKAHIDMLARIEHQEGKLLAIQITANGSSETKKLRALLAEGWIDLIDHPSVRDRRTNRPVDALVITDHGRKAMAEAVALDKLRPVR